MSVHVKREPHAAGVTGYCTVMIVILTMVSLLVYWYINGSCMRCFFEWHCTIEDMSKHIPPSQLQLFLVCDVEDIEIVKKVLRPLLKLPVLASCNIRLGRDQDSSLYNLARQAATRAVGQTSSSAIPEKPFRFLDLPLELQHQILEYTDLVTPWREITWDPEEKFYLHYDQPYCKDIQCAASH